MEKEGYGKDEIDSLISSLNSDFRTARIDALEMASLEYAVKLTREPCSVDSSDIDLLRRAGLDDRGIHDLCAITSYFAFVNRMADGLGVELEGRFSGHG